jgi:hypothetical protein
MNTRHASYRRIRCGVAAVLVAVALASPASAGKADNSVRFAYDQTLANVDPFFNTSPLGAIVDEVPRFCEMRWR